MNKKLKGYSSVILIIFVAITAMIISYIALSQYQNSLIQSNRNDFIQSKYITESYLNYLVANIKENKSIEDISIKENLFSDFDFDINTLKLYTEDITYDNIPSVNFKINSSYKEIPTNGEVTVSKYNKIFFLEKPIINSSTLDDKEVKYFEEFKKSIGEGKKYNEKYEVINPNTELIIASRGIPALYYYNGEEFIKDSNLNSVGNYIFDDLNYFGFPEENSGTVSLYGTFYIEGHIELHTNLILNGIVISNNGSINTNLYSSRINGILLEIGESGNFSKTNINYSKLYINSNLNLLENTKYHEVLALKINNWCIIIHFIKGISMV